VRPVGCPELVEDLPEVAHRHAWYRFLVVSQAPPPIRTSTGFLIHPELGLEAVEEADTVVIPG
jgi:hypothetical protein